MILIGYFLGVLLCGGTHPAWAICTDTRDYLRLIGSVDTRSDANDLQIADGFAYVAAGNAGLIVVDVNNVYRPTVMKELNISGRANAIIVQDEFAYVATEFGMSIVNLSTPSNPHLTGGVSLPASAIDLAVEGPWAFVADGYEGVHVVDVSDPEYPEVEGSVTLDDFAYGVALQGNYLFVAEHRSGLRIVDIQDPASPVLINLIALPSAAFNVSLADNHAFVTTQYSGIQIVNVEIPESASIVGSCGIPGSLGGIFHFGDIALVAAGGAGLAFIDVSPAGTAEFIGIVDTPGVARHSFAEQGFAFVADSDGGLQIIEFRDFAGPQMLGMGDDTINFSPYGMTIDGNLAYLIGAGGMRIVDVSNPAIPTQIGRWNSSSSGYDVVIRDGLAYCAIYMGGLTILDVSNPGAISFVGRESVNYATQLVLSGDHVVVAAETRGIVLLDVANPENPKTVKTVRTSGNAVDVALYGDYLYVAEENKGVQIFDSPHPEDSKYLGQIDTPGDATVVVVDGDELYVGDSVAGLLIYSLVDPASPGPLGQVLLSGYIREISILGDIAYVCSGANILAVDIFDKSRPQIIGPAGVAGRDFSVANGFLVCAATPGLVRTYPLQCQLQFLNPRMIVGYSPVEIPEDGGIFEFDLEINNSYEVPRIATVQFEAELSDGRIFPIYEVPDRIFPVAPQFRRNGLVQKVPGWAPAGVYIFRCLVVDELGVVRSSEFSFSKDGEIVPGISVEDNSTGGWNLSGLGTGDERQHHSVLNNGNCSGGFPSPNPFNGTVNIHFEVPSSGEASLTIYDVAGRAVKHIFSKRHIEQGSLEAAWDGRDDRDRAVAAGVYFFTFQSAGLNQTGRMVLIK